MSRVTIYDIAHELDISTSTVSRVLNGSALISEATSERIKEVADRLGYEKRRIRRHRERAVLNIKVVLPRRQAAHLNLFYDLTDLISGMKDGLAPARANLVCEIEDSRLDLFSHKKGGDVDGVIFAFTTANSRITDALEERNIPYVFLNRVREDNDYITCDHVTAMTTLMQEVKNQNRGFKPLYVNLSAVTDLAEERLGGMRAACRTLHINFNDRLDVWTVANVNQIYAEMIADNLTQGYDCFVCFNDVIAVSILQKAQSAGLRIPDDFMLTGFDNSPVIQIVSPQISTMSLPVYDIGSHAGKWIQHRVIDRQTTMMQEYLHSTYHAGETI
jgi:LacI family transcriptional regulator